MPVRRTRGSGARQRATDATMRVSDAERAEVADHLAQHYGDGRLDQAELDERLSRAMSAKTRADLTGITDDLPEVETRPAGRTGAYPGRALTPAPRPRRQWPRVLGIVLLIVVVSATWHGVVSSWPWSWFGFGFGFGPWLWIALLAFCWLRFGPRRHHE